MKKLLFFTLQLLAISLYAQSPQMINYQGAVRDAAGLPVKNKAVGIRFEFRQPSVSSPTVFIEEQTVTTNALGLFSTQIGKINTTGISQLNWEAGSLFLTVGVDTTGGTSYVSLGSQQLVSVPYAMHAESVPATYSNSILTVGKQSFTLSSSSSTIDIQGGTNVTVGGAYPNYTVSSTPSLSLVSPNTLSISGGNTVDITPPITYTNNVLTVGAPSNSVAITSGTSPVTPNTTITPGGLANVTNPATNSFVVSVPDPTLSVLGNTLSVSQGTAVSTSTIALPPTTSLTAGTNVSITGAAPDYTVSSTPTLNLLTANTLSISGGNSVTIAPSLSVTGNNLSVGPITNTVSIAPAFTGSGAVTVNGTFPNYTIFATPAGSVTVQTTSVTGTNLANVTSTATNLYNVDVPAPVLTNTGNVISLSQGTAITSVTLPVSPTYTNGTGISITSGSVITNTSPGITPTVVITTTAAPVASVTSVGSSFSLNVPPPTFTNSGPTTITGTYPNYTVTSSAATTTVSAAGIATVSPGPNFTVGVQTPTFTNSGQSIITGSYPNYVVNTPTTAATPTVSAAGIATVSAGPNYLVGVQSPTFTNSGQTIITGSYPNYVVNTPTTAASPTVSAAGIATVSAGPNYLVGVQSPTFTNSGQTIITGSYPNYVVNTPTTAATPTVSAAGIATVSAGPNYLVGVQSPTFTNSGQSIITGSYPNYVVNTPTTAVTPTVSAAGIATVSAGPNYLVGVQSPTFTNSGQTIITGSYPNYVVNTPTTAATPTVSAAGIATVSAGPNYLVGVQSPTFTNSGQTIITGSYPNYVVNTPTSAAAVTPSIVLTTTAAPGASVASVGSSFSLNVPPPAFTNSGQNIITGTYPNFTVNTPTVAVTPTVSAAGIATVSAGPNYLVGVQSPTFTNSGQSIITGSYPNYVVNTPTTAATPTVSAAGIATVSAGPNYLVGVQSPTFTNSGQSIITGSYPNYVVNTPTTAATPTVSAAGIATVSAGPNYLVGVQSPTFTNSGQSIITGSYPNYVVNTPTVAVTPTVSAAGIATVSAGPNYLVGVQSPTFTNSGQSIITGSYPNYVVNTPTVAVTPTVSAAGIASVSAGPNYTVGVQSPNFNNTGPQTIISGTWPNISVATSTVAIALTATAAAGPSVAGTGYSYNINIPPAANTWSLGGNAGTTPGTNYLGTSDAQALVFKTNATEQMRISSGGLVGIGTNNPTENFQVETTGSTGMAIISNATGISSLFFGYPAFHPNGNIQYNNSTNFMNFWTGNTSRMTIDNAGNVGIGNAAPHAPLQFANSTVLRKIVLSETANNDHQIMGFGLSAANILRYQVDAATSNHVFSSGITSGSSLELMRITGAGRVGIGITAPSTTFAIGNGTTEKFNINGTEGDMNFLDDQASITFAVPTATAKPMMQMFASGSNNLDRMVISHNPSNPTWGLQYQDVGDKFNFLASGNPVLTIDLGTSNVGVGTSSPGINPTGGGTTRYLSLSSATSYVNAPMALELEGAYLGTGVPHAKIDFNSWGLAATSFNVSRIASHNGGTVGEGRLIFSTRDGTTLLERMRITENGNVGIGVTAPTATFQVNGTTRLVDGNQGAGKILTSDATGNATWAVPSNYNTGFSAYYAGTYTFSSIGSSIVPFTNVLYNDGGNFNLATETYIAPSDGLYHFDASIRIDGYTAGQYTYLSLYVNGSLMKTNTAASNSADFSLDISGDLKLVSGDAVTLRYYQSSSPHTSPASSVVYFFNGHKVY